MSSRTWQTRERLVRALVSLTREKPYDQVRVRDLLERAQVGRATFYAHYRDKEDLLITTFLEMVDFFEARAAEAGSAEVLPAARGLLAHFHDGKEFARALLRSGKFEVLTRALEARLRRNLEARLPAEPLPGLTAALICGAFVKMLDWWMAQGMKIPPTELADAFERIARRAVAA
jgi:AcrR family transcriptional regulator